MISTYLFIWLSYILYVPKCTLLLLLFIIYFFIFSIIQVLSAMGIWKLATR